VILACVLVTWSAGAGAAPGRAGDAFWDRVIAQHDREVAEILAQAGQLHERAGRPVITARDEAVRQRLLDDARGMLRYAARRAPDHRGVLEMLAYVEEASGRVEQALELYHRVTEGQPDEISAESCLRHGQLLARTGAHAQAMKKLRACLELPGRMSAFGSQFSRTAALVHLANLQAQGGRVNEATSLLAHHASVQPADPFARFALAVIYDKDEQISRAYEILDQLKAQHQGVLALTLSRSFDQFDFLPAADQHYYLALLYETTGHLAEAREEWHNYVQSGDEAPHARRARQHIKAIDSLLARSRRSTATRSRR
jgi:tetratricopeptide (TPR) repeat protein